MKRHIEVRQSARTTADQKHQKTFVFWDGQIHNLNVCQVIIITTRKASGVPNAAPKSLNMYCCDAPNLFAFCCGQGHHTYDNILRDGEFAVNYPTLGLEKQVWQLNRRQSLDTDEIAACGLTAEPAQKIQAPLIAECPLNLECRLERVIDFYPGMSMLIGEVIAARIHPQLDQLEPAKFNPFIMDARHAYFYLRDTHG